MSAEKRREICLKQFEENKDRFNGRVAEDIEKYRKGDIVLKFTDKNGDCIANKTVKIEQISHGFKFGANLFMLDQFESLEENMDYACSGCIRSNSCFKRT